MHTLVFGGGRLGNFPPLYIEAFTALLRDFAVKTIKISAEQNTTDRGESVALSGRKTTGADL